MTGENDTETAETEALGEESEPGSDPDGDELDASEAVGGDEIVGAEPLGRTDLWVALLVSALSAALYMWTFSSNVLTGDEPEAVAGIHNFGIIHAPGYPAYVVLARAFTALVPFGSFAGRVHLFSVLCAVLAIAGLYLLSRLIGATRTGAAIGGLTIASAASFWFYSSYGKHYSLIGMLVIWAAVCAYVWQRDGRSRWLVVAGVLLGIGLGATWQLSAFMAIGIAVLLYTGPRRPARGLIVTALVVMVAVGVACYVWLLIRAGQDPRLNYGNANSLGRLWNLISQKDFSKFYSDSEVDNALLRYPLRIVTYPAIVARDVGLWAIAVAIAGAVVVVRFAERQTKWFLLTIAVLNLIGVIAIYPIDHIRGFRTGMIVGGYVLLVLIVVGVLVAVGFTYVVDSIVAHDNTERWVPIVVGTIVAALLLVPAVRYHYEPANHRIPPIVDDYARRALADLPPNVVLFVYQADMQFPFDYAQIVKNIRPDVSVINADNFGLDWYAEQTAERLSTTPDLSKAPLDRALATIDQLRGKRPVFLDPGAMQLLQDQRGYKIDGFVGELVDGKGPQKVADLKKQAEALDAADRADDVAGADHLRFANHALLELRSRLHLELAKAAIKADDVRTALQELARAYDINPDDDRLPVMLEFMKQRGTGAENVILAL